MSNESRAAFEAWHGEQYGYCGKPVGLNPATATYAAPAQQDRWEAWQASHEVALSEAEQQCKQLAACEESTEGYRNGAAWCAERIGSLK